jgi:two-component system, OmpR family, sensor histidine kinase BaeS
MGHTPQLEQIVRGVDRRAPVVVDGRQVGTAVVIFTSGELAVAETHVRDALRGTVLLGAIGAALVAVAIAIPLARRVIRPLARVTDTARRLGDGDITARVGDHDAPGELGTLAVTFDEMADRLQAHETTRHNLTADIAHELRTPLTVLQGNCEEIIDGIAEPSMERFVQMHDDVLRLRRLVDDLGTLADADADADAAGTEPMLRRERCGLAAVAGHVADSMMALIEANQHQLTRHLESVTVDGDPVRLAQIVTNLLSNAIKYTPPGGHIDLDVRSDPQQRLVTLTVADDGPGISATDRPHAFERFYRADSAPVARSGIGLAVVDQLVRAHRGHVEIADTTTGTTVTVTLPSSSNG